MTAEVRPATDADRPFFVALYARNRAAELDGVAWSPAAKDAFFAQQFDAQEASHHMWFPSADVSVLVVDGAAAGRLVVDHSADAVHVVDVLLDPSVRGHGVGTSVLRDVLAVADAANAPVTLHVDVIAAGVRRWYERLGFVAVEHDTGAASVLYRRDPSTTQANTAS